MEDRIAIIGAMNEEVEALRQELAMGQEIDSSFSILSIFQGSLEDQDVVIARCGVGKVNAALATQYIIDHYNPRVIINSGVAGGVSPNVRIGDLVIGTSAMHHDFDVQKFGYLKGIIPSLETSVFQAESRLTLLASQAAAAELGTAKVHQGLIVSGDQFISSREQKQEILDFFPDAICVEMEGAAIAQVASLNQIPHLIIRAISDQADNTAPDDFDQYLKGIIFHLNAVIRRLMRSLKLA